VLRHSFTAVFVWLRGTVVECRSVTSELSLSSARLAADGDYLCG